MLTIARYCLLHAVILLAATLPGLDRTAFCYGKRNPQKKRGDPLDRFNKLSDADVQRIAQEWDEDEDEDPDDPAVMRRRAAMAGGGGGFGGGFGAGGGGGMIVRGFAEPCRKFDRNRFRIETVKWDVHGDEHDVEYCKKVLTLARKT